MFEKTQCKNACKNKGSAKVVGGALVLTLADALSPVVWRMDLDSVKEAAFEIDEKDNVFDLLLKEGNGTAKAKKIASFDNKDKAMAALMQTAAALESAHSVGQASPAAQMASSNEAPENMSAKKGGGLIGLIIGLVLLALLIFGLTRLTPQSVRMTPASENSVAAGAVSNGAGGAGAPISADQFLMGR